ncbi:hypothetical protein JCM6882_002801 [Rhodosporidiobolus microsporus]
MPLLFSRRKSEANLRSSPPSTTTPPAEPLPSSSPSLFKLAGGRAPPVSRPATASRSRSVGRAGGAEERPARGTPAAATTREKRMEGALPLPPTTAARARQSRGESSGGWVVLDEEGTAGASRSGSGTSTPIAARFGASSGNGATRGYATPPRRDSSFASSVTTVSSASAAFTSPPNSSTSNLVASPSFFASSPPTSDGGHDSFSLDFPIASAAPKPSREREQTPTNGISQTFATSSSAVADSPNSSFISPGASPALARFDRFDQPSHRAAAGLPASSSFYNFGGAVSPGSSPARSPAALRSGSLMRRQGNGSFPVVAEEGEAEAGGLDSPTVGRVRRAESEGYEAERFARESTRRREQTSPPSSTPSALRNLSPSPSITSPLHVLSSAYSSPTLSGSSSPPLRGSYNPLAAFFGTASTNSTASFASPSLSAASSFGTPATGLGFSSSASGEEDGEGSAVTPATSDGEEEEEESPLVTPPDDKPFLPPPPTAATKPALAPPIQLDPTSIRPRAGSKHSPQNSNATPTQATFPLSPPVEKVAAPSPSSSSTRSPSTSTEQASSPTRPARRESLPSTAAAVPVSPARTARRSGSEGRVSLEGVASAAHVAPKKERTSGEAGRPSVETPPEPLAKPTKPSPAPLQATALAASSPKPTHPAPSSATASLPSPRTPRTPLTPTSLKSPRALPAAALALEPPPSPPKQRRVTNEGTPRTLALKAARERERRVASEEAEVVGGSTVEEVAVAEQPKGDEKVEMKEARKEGAEAERLEEEAEEEVPLQPRVEYAFSLYAPALLHSLLHHISFTDLITLRQVSKTLRRSIDEGDAKEVVLERFLGAQGYRRFAPVSSSSRKRRVVVTPSDSITLDIRDLIAFRAGLALPPDAYSHLARAYASSAPEHFSATSLKLARATTRAWNRVVLRLRSQTLLPAEAFAPPAFPALAPAPQPVYKTGRAAALRVWVPLASSTSAAAAEGWMTDAEVVECEREVWRAGNGAWAQMKKGDIVSNVACEAFGNVGKMVFDGRYLRDLAFSFDVVGHLPPWLNMLALSPSYYHNIVVSSSSDPVFYLSLAPFVASVRETIQLCNDRVSLSSPQGNYVVKKFVYRAGIKIKSGQIIGSAAGVGGSGPGGIDVVHDDWVGQLVLETDGTTEHATMLVARAASTEPTPWRILRSKCRPGKLWLKPVLDAEAC